MARKSALGLEAFFPQDDKPAQTADAPRKKTVISEDRNTEIKFANNNNTNIASAPDNEFAGFFGTKRPAAKGTKKPAPSALAAKLAPALAPPATRGQSMAVPSPGQARNQSMAVPASRGVSIFAPPTDSETRASMAAPRASCATNRASCVTTRASCATTRASVFAHVSPEARKSGLRYSTHRMTALSAAPLLLESLVPEEEEQHPAEAEEEEAAAEEEPVKEEKRDVFGKKPAPKPKYVPGQREQRFRPEQVNRAVVFKEDLAKALKTEDLDLLLAVFSMAMDLDCTLGNSTLMLATRHDLESIRKKLRIALKHQIAAAMKEDNVDDLEGIFEKIKGDRLMKALSRFPEVYRGQTYLRLRQAHTEVEDMETDDDDEVRDKKFLKLETAIRKAKGVQGLEKYVAASEALLVEDEAAPEEAQENLGDTLSTGVPPSAVASPAPVVGEGEENAQKEGGEQDNGEEKADGEGSESEYEDGEGSEEEQEGEGEKEAEGDGEEEATF